MDMRELLVHMRSGSGNRQIAEDMGIDRRTVGRYRTWAEEQGLLEGALPSLGELLALLEQTMPTHHPPQNVSTVEPYRALVARLVKENVEIAAIRKRLMLFLRPGAACRSFRPPSARRHNAQRLACAGPKAVPGGPGPETRAHPDAPRPGP
jgi:hypothetical protein